MATRVDPQPVRQIELPVRFAVTAKRGQPFVIFIIAVDTVSPVAIGEVEPTVRRVEGKIRRHEPVPPPHFRRLGILTFLVTLRLHRRALLPHLFARQRQLGEILQVLVAGDV